VPLSLAGQAGSSASQTAADLQRGEAALKANDNTAATEYFRSALRHDPNNAKAHAELGAIAFSEGDCSSAEENFRSVLHSSPELTKVLALLSVCEMRRGEPLGQADMEKAFAKLEDVKLRLQIGTELANAYYQQGDFEKTSSMLHTLLDIDPDNVDILFFAQRVYSELAETTLNKLAILSPNSARMEQLIAERLINAGDLKDAANHYRKALEMNPKLPGLHLELAETLLEDSPNKTETQKEARQELQAAIEVDGDSSKIECQLARLAMLQADDAQALSRYQHAYDLNPNDVDAQMGLAEALQHEDKPAEAAKYLQMAVKEYPFNAEAHYKLSLVDRQLHLVDEQKTEMQLFLDIRGTRDKIKLLYRQMNPQTTGDKVDPASGATP
jgi:tetratricopeptide (TPR) repeat protein